MWCFFLCFLVIGLPCLEANIDGDNCCDMGIDFAKNYIKSHTKVGCVVFGQNNATSSCFQTAKMCCEKYVTSSQFRRKHKRRIRKFPISSDKEKNEYSGKPAGIMEHTTSINKSEKPVKALTSTDGRDFINELKVADEPKNETNISVNCSKGFNSDENGVCKDVDECTEGSHNCSQNQYCLNTIGSHVCGCKIGFEPFSGLCADVDECATKQDNCIKDTQRCENTMGSFTCISKEETENCENLSEMPVTTNGEELIDSEPKVTGEAKNERNISVNCSTGFMSDENEICDDIDECLEGIHLCDSLQICLNINGSHECHCKPGFELDPTIGACVDIDECATGQHSCVTGIPCVNTIGSYFCIREKPCGTGYILKNTTGKCEDVDECALGTHNCARAGSAYRCVNIPGSFRCVRTRSTTSTTATTPQPIYEDYYDSENEITKENETNLQPPQLGPARVVTSTTATSSTLTPPPIVTTTAKDIDECSTGEAKCGPIQFCINLPGGYACDCPEGYKLIGDRECADVDECALPMPICPQNADCVNTIGSYRCQCQHGFRSPRSSDKYCEDINECFGNGGRVLCEQQCHNEWGGYRCGCHRGYRLNPDNRTCSDIDECTENTSKGSPCVWRCHNKPGSYKCSCPSGYTLSEDKKTCVDIDECESSPCSNDSFRCINTPGGYGCHRIDCLPGYQEVEDRCTKADKQCPLLDRECAHQPIYYSYEFISLVSNITISDCKVDLFTYASWQPELVGRFSYKLDLIDGFAPLYVQKADSSYFTLTQKDDQGVVSLVRTIEGPQSVVLELTMEVYNPYLKFVGSAVAQITVIVSEYGF